MNDRFKFRFCRYNEVLSKWTYIYADFITVDGTAQPYDDSEGGSQLIYDDCIIEQCTGSKDKNSKLIYEGDVIKTPNGSIGYIVWSQQDLGFYTKDLNPKEEEVYLFECEVIGNIHENADLLENEE